MTSRPFVLIPALCASASTLVGPQTNAQMTYTLKAVPVLRVTSGDAEEVQTPAVPPPAPEEKQPNVYVKPEDMTHP